MPSLPLGTEGSVEEVIAQKFAVIGTPDDAIAQLERLQRESGGFGCFVQLAHKWADWEKHQAKLRALFALRDATLPDRNAGRIATIETTQKAGPDLVAEHGGAIAKERRLPRAARRRGKLR